MFRMLLTLDFSCLTLVGICSLWCEDAAMLFSFVRGQVGWVALFSPAVPLQGGQRLAASVVWLPGGSGFGTLASDLFLTG